MNRIRGRALVAAGGALALVVLGVAALAVFLSRGDASPRGPDVAGALSRCAALGADAARPCYATALEELVGPAADPRAVVERIADAAWAAPGAFLLPNCHGLMHTVGREYAGAHHVTLSTLMDYLPASNDPGCSAGFAHGLISGVAPLIDPSKPQALAAVCDRTQTRYQRYSCVHGFGHAFMRVYNERLEPALALCTKLGPTRASDCAQGAFHDYWFSVAGFDNTRAAGSAPVTDPRVLCAGQRTAFVAPCWYRAFVDTRATRPQTSSPADIERLCSGLSGDQRGACVTAASVIGPPDPVDQLAICAELETDDAESCIHGTKVQNLIEYPEATHVDLIRHCGFFRNDARLECYRWLGRTLSVITNGRFGETGCPQLVPDAAAFCEEGAALIDEPLVTFS
jgi:hypothetical protein